MAKKSEASTRSRAVTVGSGKKPARGTVSKPPQRNARRPVGYDPSAHGALGITAEDWAAVSDSPPLSDEELASARPFAEVFPALAEKIRRGPGRPPLDTPKRQVTIRLDDEVVQAFRRDGKGWQARINAALRKAVGL
ncbi:MAG: BrnA antitoxin family protein [Bauldia sp.]|nr:BrnA antitoxin family protein [Bauldia sp.]MCW5718505.1 BrnA antitoxin family protein [Bauldia sp.]